MQPASSVKSFILPVPVRNIDEGNVFSEPWNDSDVVLVVEDKEFHVHRSILSLQSPVFKAMFNGNFKDAAQDKIALKDDNKYQAMLQFLKLLYPPNMLDEDKGKVDIKDENVFEILHLADKYAAVNIIKQCMKEAGRLKPGNTMRLLPYAVRNKLPLEKIFGVIARYVSTNDLTNFAPEIGKESVHIETLVKKCHFQEDVAKQANTIILYLLQKYVEVEMAKRSGTSNFPKCVQHAAFGVQEFKKARKCENCLEAYKKRFIDEYVYSPSGGLSARQGPGDRERRRQASVDFMNLLQITDDIATSLEI